MSLYGAANILSDDEDWLDVYWTMVENGVEFRVMLSVADFPILSRSLLGVSISIRRVMVD